MAKTKAQTHQIKLHFSANLEVLQGKNEQKEYIKLKSKIAMHI